MSAFQPSATLLPPRPTASAAVASTASTLSSGIESHPAHGKWWTREYGIGPRQSVRSLTRRSSEENRYTSVRFRTAVGGAAPIADLNFGGDGSLAVASGPRVSLYGGAKRTAGTSGFTRALKAGSAAQKRRDALEEDQDDDNGSVDLFGGKLKNGDDKKCAVDGANKLDSIDADRNISTGGLLAKCAAHRSDGRLVAVGTEGGTVRICDTNSRATLRTFGSESKGRDRKAIRAVAWLRDGKRVVSGGDDGAVRVWNVSGGGRDCVVRGGDVDATLRGHGDRVTSVAVISFRRDEEMLKKYKGKLGTTRPRSDATTNDGTPAWGQLIASGSYDHTVRVWNVEDSYGEDDRCLSIMDHGDPVQALLVLPPAPSGSSSKDNRLGRRASKLEDLPLLISAGGTTLKAWNPLSGACLGTFATKHAKTISSLCLLDLPRDESEEEHGAIASIGQCSRRHILTGGLDGLLRIHSVTNRDIISGTLPYLHGMRFPEPISALAISRDMSRLAIGTTAGIVAVHQRRRCLLTAFKSGPPGEEWLLLQQRREPPRPGTYLHFTRGANERPRDTEDYLLPHQKKQRLAEYDALLRGFRHGDALDAALGKRRPQAVIAVIEELGKRHSLAVALSNRDEESLDAILSFTVRFIDNPQYSPHLIGVANILIDIYGSLGGQSAAVDELFARLREKVRGECSVQRMVLRLLGQIDFVMVTAEAFDVEE